MPAPTQVRFRVRVVFLDGQEQTFEAEAPVAVQPGVLLIQGPRGGHVGLPLTSVKYWEVVGGGIAIAAGLQ
jgi:hypothetical protein